MAWWSLSYYKIPLWHSFCFEDIVMDIEKLNRKHFLGLDMYYRVGFGLSSKLIKFENGILHIEVVIGRKWKRNYNSTAAELAYAWRDSHKELSKAIACKVFIIDCKINQYKQFFIQSGIKPTYDARKGIIFAKNYLN